MHLSISRTSSVILLFAAIVPSLFSIVLAIISDLIFSSKCFIVFLFSSLI